MGINDGYNLGQSVSGSCGDEGHENDPAGYLYCTGGTGRSVSNSNKQKSPEEVKADLIIDLGLGFQLFGIAAAASVIFGILLWLPFAYMDTWLYCLIYLSLPIPIVPLLLFVSVIVTFFGLWEIVKAIFKLVTSALRKHK
jgi:hypothetical protein